MIRFNLFEVRGPELLSKWLGDSEKAVQKLFHRARSCAPSLIFFDEIDAFASKRWEISIISSFDVEVTPLLGLMIVCWPNY